MARHPLSCPPAIVLVQLVASAAAAEHGALLSSPSTWVAHLRSQQTADTTRHVDAIGAYLNFLASLLSSASLNCDLAERDMPLRKCQNMMRFGLSGTAPFAVSMAGVGRMRSLGRLIARVHKDNLPGSYLECGVWRGGMSVFAAAALEAHGLSRPVYLADSFQGLPPPRAGSDRQDEAWYTSGKINSTLAVGEQIVLANFDAYGVSRANVQTAVGYFVSGLPPLRKQLLERGEKLAILRLDGDMYDSTIDILYNVYDLVAVGGFVIIDDFGWNHATAPSGPNGTDIEAVPLFGAKKAILEYAARSPSRVWSDVCSRHSRP